MAFTKTPAYTDAQKREMRLRICSMCVFSACNNSQANKCDIATMVCTKSNDENIVSKTNNIASTCPMSYWTNTNKTLDNYVPSPGCACNKKSNR